MRDYTPVMICEFCRQPHAAYYDSTRGIWFCHFAHWMRWLEERVAVAYFMRPPGGAVRRA